MMYFANIEYALIIKDKIKTLRVLQQAKKAPDTCRSQHETTHKKKTRKINKFELLFIFVMMTGSLILVL